VSNNKLTVIDYTGDKQTNWSLFWVTFKKRKKFVLREAQDKEMRLVIVKKMRQTSYELK